MPTDGEKGAGAWWKRSSPGQRLSVLLVPLAIAVAGVTAFHLVDARKRGEPLWPVLLGLGVTALILAAVVWFVGRTLRHGVTLKGYELPAGVSVGIGIVNVHRRADLYPEPEQFRPERFLERAYSAFEYLPFGAARAAASALRSRSTR